jgi:hypothetical protein
VHTSRADLSQAFCSYRGYPPIGRGRSLAHRVCMRRQMPVRTRAAQGGGRQPDPRQMSYSSTAGLAGSFSLDASLGAAPRPGAVRPRRDSIRRAGRLGQHGPSGRRRGWGEPRRRRGFQPLDQWRPKWNRTVV